MTHTGSCENSRNKKCRCSCKGSKHGKALPFRNLDNWFNDKTEVNKKLAKIGVQIIIK